MSKDDKGNFSSFMQKEKKRSQIINKDLKKAANQSDEDLLTGSYFPRIPDLDDDDYMDHFFEFSENNPKNLTYPEWLYQKFKAPDQPVELFNEYPQGNRHAPDSDIHAENEYARELNRNGNIAGNCYFYFYDQIIKNYPEDYEKGTIEADKIIKAMVLFATHVFTDIVQSGVYDADDALKVFYEGLAKNYQYLQEMSKAEKKQKLYGVYKEMKLRRA